MDIIKAVPSARDGGGARELICRAFGCETKAINEQERTVDVVMSTDTIDRYGESVTQDWDLVAFSKNPVCLWAHDYRTLPVGRVENVRVTNGALNGTIRFASALANPLAENCFQLFREKVLNAVSVGFISHSYRYEKIDDIEFLVLDKNELVELSCTGVPANPEALAKMRALAHGNSATAPTKPRTSAKSGNTENSNMDLEAKSKELEAALAAAKAAHADTQKQFDASKAELAIVQERVKAVTGERDEAVANVKKLETELATANSSLIEKEVDALVGVKIDPAQKAVFLDLAKADIARFRSVVAVMPEKSTLTKVVPADPETKNKAPEVVDDGQDLASAVLATAATIQV